ncbi:MAG: hypothetical protein HYW25_00265 [Candidatus Aenigmarchaeota archaeon]|nr:hypothetical protein [Candidatus Aenigmarchaeota archaeon]
MTRVMPPVLDSYRKAQTRLGLPHFEQLQSVFQLDIEEGDDIHDIRNEISSRLFDFTERVIEPLLWSNHHSNMIEREMIADIEAGKIFEVYREIQSLRWRNNLLTIKADERSTMEWIRDLWRFWKDFEPLIEDLCIKFSEGWKNLRFKEISTEYQG